MTIINEIRRQVLIMKISLNWIKDYVSVGVTLDTLIHKLTMAGLEVEKVHTKDKDTILELEITPNRADCLNMAGMAREVAAVLNKTYEPPKIKKLKFPSQRCDIKNEDKKGCSRYIGTLIEDVKMGDAPQWMQKRLKSLEMRPINNVVDITNFCLMELGQPLHAFDYDKLIGGKIVIRRAKEGEKIVTLDNEEKVLDPSILVIADARRPVAIAGIMGGKDTEVTAETKNILLESAYFDPILIRRSARKLKLSSDSSYRFERGVSWEGVEQGADRALSFILQCAQGNIKKRSDSCWGQAKKQLTVEVTLKQINGYLGAELSIRECKNILKKLDFVVTVSKKDLLKVTPPTFRSDIKEAVDVIEEVARSIGYDHLPLSLPQIKPSTMPANPRRDMRRGLRETLCAQGFNEVITYSMVNQTMLEKVKQGELKGVTVKNPLTQEQEKMRPSLFPSLLTVLQTNLNRGQKDLKFFEIGKVYGTKGEKETLGIIMTGVKEDDWRNESKEKKKVDFYDLKGAMEHALGGFVTKQMKFEVKEAEYFVEGESASICLRNKNIGILGRVAGDVLENFQIKQRDVFFAQVDLEIIHIENVKPKKYVPIIEFPAIIRDVSLAVKEDITFQQIKDIVFERGEKLLKEVNFLEQYLGDKISTGYRGIMFSLKYQSFERTLREEEVNAIHEKIEETLVSTLGVIRR